MITRPMNKKMAICIEFANGESKEITGAKYLNLSLQDKSLTFRHDENLVYVNLNNVNQIKFIEEKETEEDANN